MFDIKCCIITMLGEPHSNGTVGRDTTADTDMARWGEESHGPGSNAWLRLDCDAVAAVNKAAFIDSLYKWSSIKLCRHHASHSWSKQAIPWGACDHAGFVLSCWGPVGSKSWSGRPWQSNRYLELDRNLALLRVSSLPSYNQRGMAFLGGRTCCWSTSTFQKVKPVYF